MWCGCGRQELKVVNIQHLVPFQFARFLLRNPYYATA